MQMLKLILVFFFSLALLAFSGGISCGEDLISKTCKSTPNSRICERSLRADPRSSTANKTELILIMIDVVQSNFNDSLKYVNKLIKESPPSKVLQDCQLSFDYSISGFIPGAKYGVQTSGSIDDIISSADAMRSCGHDALFCGITLKRVGGDSGLIQQTKKLDVLSNIVASMIDTVK